VKILIQRLLCNEKLSKAAIKSIADRYSYSVLNGQGAFRKIEATQAENGSGKVSHGRVLGPEVLAEREAFAANKRLDIVRYSFRPSKNNTTLPRVLFVIR
jgi:hypothetical protein